MPPARGHVPASPVSSDADPPPPRDLGSAQPAPVLLLLPGGVEEAPDVDASSACLRRGEADDGAAPAHGSAHRSKGRTRRTLEGQPTVRAALSRLACSEIASLAYELLHVAEEAERDHSTERAAAVLRLLVQLVQTAGTCLRGEELTTEAIRGAQAGTSLRQAARLLGVPRSTLYDRVQRAERVLGVRRRR